MQSSCLSAPVMVLNPSLVPIAVWDSRVSLISRDEPKRTKVRGTGFVFLLAAFVGLCVTTELRAQVIVVPNTLATNDGNSSNTTPDGPGSVREMQIYDASQFGALSGPSFLTQFAYRPDTIPGPSGPRTATLRIFASTTSRSTTGLSPTFADNVGVDKVLVFDGTLTWTTANLPGPGNTRQFDVVFPLTTPFLYDPAAGNLLLDIQFTVDGSSIRFDSVTGNPMLGEIINLGSSTGTSGQTLISPKPTQFTFEPSPCSRSAHLKWKCAGTASQPSPLKCNIVENGRRTSGPPSRHSEHRRHKLYL